MRHRSRRALASLVLCLSVTVALGGVLAARTTRAGAHNPCQQPGNLTINCGFDEFAEDTHNGKRLVFPRGWWYYIVEGEPDFRQAVDTYWGPPSLEIVSDGVPFTAGIYQQVQVTPGLVYTADIGWFPVDAPDFERKIGLDPHGGTNPLAPSVVWSRADTDLDIKWPDLTVSARAKGPTMTVFVWARHWISHGADSIYMDAVGLWPDLTQPPATATPEPSLTPTRRPPAQAAKPNPASPTPAPASPTPTPMVTTAPSETPTLSPSPTWTVTPSPAPPTHTAVPTPTATRTAVPVAQVRSAVSSKVGAGVSPRAKHQTSGEVGLRYLALAASGGAVLLGGTGVGLWAHTRRKRNRE